MKKSLALLGGCLCVSMALLTGCGSSPSETEDDSAKVTEVSLSKVTLSKDSYSRSVTASEADKNEVASSLANEDIASKMSSAADYSNVSVSKNSSSRDLSYSDLNTIYENIYEAFKDFNKNLVENGTASACYEVEIGEITDLPSRFDGITMSIPKIKVAEDATYETVTDEDSERSVAVKYTDNYTQCIESEMTEDLTTTMGDDVGEIKNYAANSAQNYKTSYAYAFDYDSYKTLKEEYEAAVEAAETAAEEAGTSKRELNKTLRELQQNFYSSVNELYSTTYTASIDYATSSVMAFVTETNSIAGKLKIDINLAGDLVNRSSDTEVTTGHKSQKSLVDDDNFTASVTMDVYDMDNNFLFNYKTVSTANGDSVEDVLEFISFLDTTDLESMYSSDESGDESESGDDGSEGEEE